MRTLVGSTTRHQITTIPELTLFLTVVLAPTPSMPKLDRATCIGEGDAHVVVAPDPGLLQAWLPT
jgi:hypothetical protein